MLEKSQRGFLKVIIYLFVVSLSSVSADIIKLQIEQPSIVKVIQSLKDGSKLF